MKTQLLLIIAVGLLAGCGEKTKSDKPAQATNAPAATQTNTPASSGGNPLTAPVDYLNAVVKAQQVATKQVDVAFINQAIQQFNVMEGRNPKDLNELVEKKYIGQIPPVPYGSKLDYDAGSGQVKVVKQ